MPVVEQLSSRDYYMRIAYKTYYSHYNLVLI